jgi:hypothetical protein
MNSLKLPSPLLFLQTSLICYMQAVTMLYFHSSLYFLHVLVLFSFYCLTLWSLNVTATTDPGYLREEHIEQIKLGLEYVRGRRQEEMS